MDWRNTPPDCQPVPSDCVCRDLGTRPVRGKCAEKWRAVQKCSVEKTAARLAIARRNSLKTIRCGHTSGTRKRSPMANLRSALEELPLIKQISSHRFNWAPTPGKDRFAGLVYPNIRAGWILPQKQEMQHTCGTRDRCLAVSFISGSLKGKTDGGSATLADA
jgi:hypothetical protein